MASRKRLQIPQREIYKRRIENLLKNPPSTKIEGPGSMELDSHWAKYTCVLVSGYMEKSVKEILMSYAQGKSENRVSHYVEKSWPNSMNMNTKNIVSVVEKFDVDWKREVISWLGSGLDSNGSIIDSIVKMRNNIAHGDEKKTTGVTMNSVTTQFEIAKKLIAKLETLVI